MHSYPFYFADWRGSEAVVMMTAEQRGVYRELIDHAWEKGDLPTDEQILRQLARVTVEEWARSWPVIRPLFVELDGRLHLTKVDTKRSAIEAAKIGRSSAASKAAKKRWEREKSTAVENMRKSNSQSNSKVIITMRNEPDAYEQLPLNHDNDARGILPACGTPSPSPSPSPSTAAAVVPLLESVAACPALDWVRLDAAAAAAILNRCRTVDPKCTVDEITLALWTRSETAKRAENPAGLLITATPDHFRNGGSPTMRKYRMQQAAAARAS